MRIDRAGEYVEHQPGPHRLTLDERGEFLAVPRPPCARLQSNRYQIWYATQVATNEMP